MSVISDDELDFGEEEEVSCGWCHEEGLEWRLEPQGWRLLDATGRQHRCSASPHTLDDFDVIDG